MIPLLVDEAYAFDYLSILQIKVYKNPSGAAYRTALNCAHQIASEVSNFSKVVESAEYGELALANLWIFELMDRAKENKATSKDLDIGNVIRYRAKQKLQKRWFPNYKLVERKI
jgi:hypothetical protein